MLKIIPLYCFAFFSFSNINAQNGMKAIIVAQNASFEWGKISQADLDMKVYPLDSSADAVVLNNSGEQSIPLEGRASIFKQHKRWKFLKKSAFASLGFFEIPYDPSNQRERFLSLRAQVIQPDGRIRVLKESEFFEEKISDYYSMKKIVFPALAEGTIAEIEYEIASDYIFHLRDWFFQDIIPVRRCDLNISYPKSFGYLIGVVGNFPVRTGKKIKTNLYLEENHFYADSIYGMKPEKFLTSIKDYLTHFYFQSNEYGFKNFEKQNIKASWTAYVNHLLDETDFGNYFHHRKYGDAWKELEPKIQETLTDEQKISLIFNFVKEKIEWTGREEMFPAESLNKVFKEKKGDCADINILLIALLNEAGIKAQPVLISSRSHGKSIEWYPVTNQFNYVICLVELKDKQILLDATDPFLPLDLIRTDALNSRGFVVDKKNSHWIDIVPQDGFSQRALNVVADKNFQLSGTFISSSKGYDAYLNRRIAAKKDEAEKALIENLSYGGAEAKIDSIVISNLRDLSEPLKTSVNFKITEAVNTNGEISYMNPTLNLFDFSKNPFKEKEREYPIDFEYPLRKNFIATIDIPDNYTVSDLPKVLKLALLNNDAVFQYIVTSNPHQIICNIKLTLTRLHYEAEDYKTLKNFFDQIEAKLNEQVVLKKK